MKNILTTLALSSIILFTGCENSDTDYEEVLNPNKPKITLVGKINMELNLGTTSITEEGYSAYDQADGDLTSSIRREHNIDFTKIGEYTVTYKVEDSDGYKNTKYRYVKIVNPLSSGTNNGNGSTIDPFYNNGETYRGSAPVITLSDDGPIYLALGESLNISFTATDFEDGNLGNHVVVEGANFNINQEASNIVLYTVTDSDENTVSKALTVIVGSQSSWTDTSVSDIDSFKTWYRTECGRSFKSSLYNETTGRYSGEISCANRGLHYVDLNPMSIFTSIDSIDFSHNNLEDIDFAPLANTHVIKKLDLSYNKFNYIDFSPLYNLHNINELWINGNSLNYTKSERIELYEGFNNRSFTVYF